MRRPRKTLRRTLPGAVATLLAVAWPAAAAPPWSDPVRIEVPRDSARACGLIIDTDGRALAAATGMERDGESRRTYLSTRAPGGQFARSINFADGCDSMVRSGPRTALLEVGSRVIEVTTDGRLMGVARNVWGELTANLDGTAVSARFEQIGDDADDPGRMRARLRARRGSPFGRAVTLARPRSDYPETQAVDVAVGPRGEVAVVWADRHPRTQRGSIFARVKPAGRRRFERAVRLGPGGSFAAVASTYARSGRLYVVWVTSRLARPGERYAVRATSVAPTARRPGRVRTLEAGRTFKGHLARSRVVATPNGGAVAVWNAARREHPQWEIASLHVASAGSDGTFGGRRTLAFDGELDDLAVAERTGAVLATWTTRFPNINGTVMSALGSPDGRFSAPEAVSGPGSFGGQAAFAPTDASVTDIWTRFIDDGNPEPPIEVQFADRGQPPR